jgi:hypothetical protein
MFRRITTFLRKRKVEQELDDELRASLELLAEEHIANGGEQGTEFFFPPERAGQENSVPFSFPFLKRGASH